MIKQDPGCKIKEISFKARHTFNFINSSVSRSSVTVISSISAACLGAFSLRYSVFNTVLDFLVP